MNDSSYMVNAYCQDWDLHYLVANNADREVTYALGLDIWFSVRFCDVAVF